MTKKKLTILILSITGAVILSLVLYVGLSEYKDGARVLPESTAVSEIALVPAQIDVIDIETAPSPSPSPQPDQPDGAVDILVDGKAVVSVSDEAAAKALLTKLLNVSAVAPEEEIFLSASYDSDIRIVSAMGSAPFYDFNTAFQLLFSEPTLVPVTVKTLRQTVSTGETSASSAKNPAIYEGARKILQLGAGARTVTNTELTYIGDQVISTGEPVSEVVMEARSTMLETGTFDQSNKDRDAGEKGRNADMKMIYPMKGTVTSYFGVEDGVFISGLELEAKAGATVVAPAEGVVLYCGERGAYGLTVDIDHGNGFVSRLTHLDQVEVELNQRVFQGNAVGKLAPSAVSGQKPIFHYELLIDGIPYNPLFYLK